MSKEAMKLALEALENAIHPWEKEGAITALREALAQQALDKKAENARELGLDYEPSSVSKLALEAGIRDCTCNGTKGCLDRFASLVRADEREVCAKVAETYRDWDDTGMGVAAAIRARSNT